MASTNLSDVVTPRRRYPRNGFVGGGTRGIWSHYGETNLDATAKNIAPLTALNGNFQEIYGASICQK